MKKEHNTPTRSTSEPLFVRLDDDPPRPDLDNDEETPHLSRWEYEAELQHRKLLTRTLIVLLLGGTFLFWAIASYYLRPEVQQRLQQEWRATTTGNW